MTDLNGLVVGKTDIFDHLTARYGEEIAAILAQDDVRWLEQIKESSFKKNLKKTANVAGKRLNFQVPQNGKLWNADNCGTADFLPKDQYESRCRHNGNRTGNGHDS